MLEQLKYVNHLGEVIEFGRKGIFVNSNDLRDYEWTYDSSRSKAENFRRGVVTKTIPVVISAESKKKCIDIKNQIYEICEKDIIAEQKGRLYIDSYYLECYMFSSEKSNYLDSATTINISLKAVSDDGMWVCEETIEFRDGENGKLDGKAYEYDYEYDYSLADDNVESLSVGGFSKCDFVLTFYGPVADPYMTIDQHRYSMRGCVIEENESLVINSKDGTITLHTAEGDVNMFSKRDKENDIFKKISPGNHLVFWGANDFDLTLIYERGEPPWM